MIIPFKFTQRMFKYYSVDLMRELLSHLLTLLQNEITKTGDKVNNINFREKILEMKGNKTEYIKTVDFDGYKLDVYGWNRTVIIL